VRLARVIAEEMGLPKERIESIEIAGNLHDIGKIKVPIEILSKSGQLSDLEFEIIKTHCQVGYDIIKSIDFPWPVGEIILQHHERIDGSGYPRGLKRENILIEAQILAVADVVEAMSSHRPYRPSLGINAALEEIEKNRGILYEPEVVDVCLRLFREDRFSFN
jgi:putative nucleotidyltransferase with HDIG domain